MSSLHKLFLDSWMERLCPVMSDFFAPLTGEKLLTLKQRLQFAMAQRRQEERLRKAELRRLDNEDCEEEEEEEEEDMTDEEEVGGCLCPLLCLLIIVGSVVVIEPHFCSFLECRGFTGG